MKNPFENTFKTMQNTAEEKFLASCVSSRRTLAKLLTVPVLNYEV